MGMKEYWTGASIGLVEKCVKDVAAMLEDAAAIVLAAISSISCHLRAQLRAGHLSGLPNSVIYKQSVSKGFLCLVQVIESYQPFD